MIGMVARPTQTVDRATIVYLDRQIETQGRRLPWLAETIGMPYPTLYKYMRTGRALRIGDLLAILDALGLDPAAALKEIRDIAQRMTGDEPDDEQ